MRVAELKRLINKIPLDNSADIVIAELINSDGSEKTYAQMYDKQIINDIKYADDDEQVMFDVVDVKIGQGTSKGEVFITLEEI